MNVDYIEFTKKIFAYKPDKTMNILHCVLGLIGEYFESCLEMTKYDKAQLALMRYKATHTEYDSTLTELRVDIEKQEKAIQKEFGDMMYYFHKLEEFLPFLERAEDAQLMESASKMTLTFIIDQFLDQVKNRIFYNRDVEIEPIFFFLKVVEMIQHCGLNVNEIIEQNKEKLNKRYPEGFFSPEAAAAKADATT